jgi:hypothetical protein
VMSAPENRLSASEVPAGLADTDIEVKMLTRGFS